MGLINCKSCKGIATNEWYLAVGRFDAFFSYHSHCGGLDCLCSDGGDKSNICEDIDSIEKFERIKKFLSEL